MAKAYESSAYDWLFDFQTRLQGVGNSLAKEIADLISATDSAVLRTAVSKMKQGTATSVKESMRQLAKLVTQIEKERSKGFEAAEKIAFDYGDEVVRKSESVIKDTSETRGSVFKKSLSDSKVKEILDYHPIDGKSISQWFQKAKSDDLTRITQAVQRASIEGLSVDRIAKLLRGTKENGYKDGVFETTRSSAQMVARTIINGVSTNAMLETCAENADVIDGVQFLATLDSRTCPFCGSYDGKIWKPKDVLKAKRPPLHPNCRCVIIPYIDMGEELEGERPAANADFDKLAEEEYKRRTQGKKGTKRWEDLSPSTRLKYYYDAQKKFEKETGKPAYSTVKGNTTFKQYFDHQPEAFKQSWLGNKRYGLYKEGKLKFDQLVNQDTGYIVPLKELGTSVDVQKDWKKHPTYSQIMNNMKENEENVLFELKKQGRKLGDGNARKQSIEINGRKIPNKADPNSSIDLMTEDGKLKKRCFYDINGNKEYEDDYLHGDNNDHIFPHRHVWIDGVRSKAIPIKGYDYGEES